MTSYFGNKTVDDLVDFVKEVFSLKGQLDKTNTREQILGSISFKGLQVYVLVASIFIASIGLNVNSTAVVIGAMLVSPLMGPIVGMGYSVAVNDYDTLKRSLQNIAIMVAVALITSFVFFSFTPINALTPELRGRLEPTILDVLVAFFGGFAGIVAASTKERNVNVVAGVAIATALMPPLCTAGYGLAMGSELIGYNGFTGFDAFFGAFYLFFINSILIALSTYLFVKILGFPLAKYEEEVKRKRNSAIVAIVVIATIVPSAFIFTGLIQDAMYKANLQSFLKKEILYKGAYIDKSDVVEVKLNDSIKVINLSSTGKIVPQGQIDTWNLKLPMYSLQNTRLILHQGVDAKALTREVSSSVFTNVFKANQRIIYVKDSTINALKHQINRLNSDTIPFKSIASEMKELYPELDRFGYAQMDYTDFKKKDILPSFFLHWITEKNREKEQERIRKYLKVRLKLDTLQFITK